MTESNMSKAIAHMLNRYKGGYIGKKCSVIKIAMFSICMAESLSEAAFNKYENYTDKLCDLLQFHSQDPRDQYLDEDRNFVVNGRSGHGFIWSQADAIFFVSEVTAIRESKNIN